jgi:hypothetical protein
MKTQMCFKLIEMLCGSMTLQRHSMTTPARHTQTKGRARSTAHRLHLLPVVTAHIFCIGSAPSSISTSGSGRRGRLRPARFCRFAPGAAARSAFATRSNAPIVAPVVCISRSSSYACGVAAKARHLALHPLTAARRSWRSLASQSPSCPRGSASPRPLAASNPSHSHAAAARGPYI